jgi:sugar/nucleoside kinase (ribokinase family)
MKNSKIVGVGACVMDTLISLPRYPAEDTKLRAYGSRPAGGGPVATGLVAASKLGVDAAYIGVLSDDGGGRFLIKDFEKYGTDTSLIRIRAGYRSFTSTIWLSEQSATRTCVFDKGNLPPLELDSEQAEAIRCARVLMVDGNELRGAVEAAKVARAAGVKVLYDCGGLYDGIEELLELTDVCIPSEEFALGHTGADTAEDAAKILFERYRPEVVVITQGVAGGIIYDGERVRRYPAFTVAAKDTNGSGDVFHGAFAAGICFGYAYEKCCYFASGVSAIKCTGVGARESVPELGTVKEFLKEYGYEL